MSERFSAPSTMGSGRGLRWLIGLVAAFAFLLGAVSCSSDDDSSESGDSGGSMELTPSSENIDGSDDSGGEASDPGSSDGSGSEESVFDPDLPVEPVELTTAEEAYRDDLLAAIDLEDGDAGIDMECLAGRWISVVGLDRFESNGVTPEVFADEGPLAIDLSQEEAREFARSYERCGMDVYDFFLPETLDPDLRACLVDSLGRGQVEEIIVAGIMGDDEATQTMQDEMETSMGACTE